MGEENYDSGNDQTDKKISIGYLPQDIISETRSSVLEETLKSFPELTRIEKKLKNKNFFLKLTIYKKLKFQLFHLLRVML